MERLLRVDERFSSAAIWKKVGDVWSCAEASTVLKWMIGKQPAEVKERLEREGNPYHWIDITPWRAA